MKHPCVRCGEPMEVRKSDLSRNKGVCVCKVCRPARKLELEHIRDKGRRHRAQDAPQRNAKRIANKQTEAEKEAIAKAIDDAQAAENLRIDKHFHVKFETTGSLLGTALWDEAVKRATPLECMRNSPLPLHHDDMITASKVCGRRNRYPENWGAEI